MEEFANVITKGVFRTNYFVLKQRTAYTARTEKAIEMIVEVIDIGRLIRVIYESNKSSNHYLISKHIFTKNMHYMST